MTIENLRTAIANANSNEAKGQFDGPTQAVTIDANDQLSDVAGYLNVVVAYKNGNPIRLKDVARVVNGAENTQLGAWMNTTPAIILNVQRQPGANVITTVDQIEKALPAQMEAGLPSGVQVALLTDRTTGIRASVLDVEFELVLAVLLVVLVIYVFLRSIPATFIASVAVPLSLVGTFAAMYLLNFSLNNLTLMALTIATGFVVDDAIVMIENISRYIEMGLKPFDAALKGAEQIGFTIISLTVSLIAVLIPLLFMGDVVGRLFNQFAITLAVTIVISAVVSLTLVPTLSARWLRGHDRAKESRFHRRTEKLFDDVVDRYDQALQWVLDRQLATMLVATAKFRRGHGGAVHPDPQGPFPDPGHRSRPGRHRHRPDRLLWPHGQASARAGGLAAEGPGRGQPVVLHRGVDGTNNTLNSGRMLINLTPHGHRTASQAAIPTSGSEKRAKEIAGITLYLQPVQDLTIDANVSPTQYQFALESSNQASINTWAAKLVDQLNKTPQVRNVSSDVQSQGLAAYISIDRTTAARLGVTVDTVDEALYDAFGQRIISTIFTQSNQYRVILEADPTLLQSPDALNHIYLPSTSGGPTPLAAFATIHVQSAPLQVTHVGQFPAANISFDASPEAWPLGAAVNARSASSRGGDRHAEHGDHDLPGRGPGLSGFAEQRAVADPGGDRHRLYRAGRAL